MKYEDKEECKTLLRRGKKEDLRTHLEPLCKDGAEDFQALYYRGILHRLDAQYVQALADFNRALVLQPNFPEALFERGSHYLHREKNIEQALVDFDKAILLRPDYIDVFRLRGTIHMKKGNWKQAVIDFNKVLRQKPTSNTIRKQRDEAWAAMEKAESDRTRTPW